MIECNRVLDSPLQELLTLGWGHHSTPKTLDASTESELTVTIGRDRPGWAKPNQSRCNNPRKRYSLAGNIFVDICSTFAEFGQGFAFNLTHTFPTDIEVFTHFGKREGLSII